MRILLGLHAFEQFAGTETYTVTVAEEMQRLGHEVIVHSSTAGPIAEVARKQGIPVIVDPNRLPPSCDALLAQDTGSAFQLAGHYPDAVRIMVVHSDYFALQSPPQIQDVCAAVVVMNDRVRSHVEHLAAPLPVVRLRQPVDLRKFGALSGIPQRAERALVLGHYLRGPAADVVAEACRTAGLEPRLVGEPTTPTGAPEQAIADVEVVIGLGRCAVEGMAGRRAVYVYGIAGADGWVTQDSYEALEADGFGGLATPSVVDQAKLAADLSEWEPEMGMINRQLANAHHNVADHAIALVALIRETAAGEAPPPPSRGDELARLVRMEWQTWSRYTGALREAGELRDALHSEQRALHEARRSGADAFAQLEDALEQLEVMRASRRYRAAMRLAAPLEAVRRRLRRGG
jgi:hypothetical protein